MSNITISVTQDLSLPYNRKSDACCAQERAYEQLQAVKHKGDLV